MKIYVRVHEEVYPQKKKEVLYFVKKSLGEIGELSDQRQNQSRTLNAVFYNVCIWHYKEQIRNIF